MGKNKEVKELRENIGKQEDQLKSLSESFSGLNSFFKKEKDKSEMIQKELQSIVEKLRYNKKNNIVIPKEKRASKEQIALVRERIAEIIKNDRKIL